MFKNMGGNISGGSFLGGNFPGGSFPDTVIQSFKYFCACYQNQLAIPPNFFRQTIFKYYYIISFSYSLNERVIIRHTQQILVSVFIIQVSNFSMKFKKYFNILLPLPLGITGCMSVHPTLSHINTLQINSYFILL